MIAVVGPWSRCRHVPVAIPTHHEIDEVDEKRFIDSVASAQKGQREMIHE